MSFVIRTSMHDSWIHIFELWAPPDTEPPPPRAPPGTDPGCPAVAFLVTAWAGRWQALGETFRGSVEHVAEEVCCFFFF